MTIHVDMKKMLDQGYLVVRQCVPEDQLEPMRQHGEQMLERHKQWWTDNRAPDDPPGGEWQTSIQPRVLFDRVVDRENCQSVEFVFHENTYGVSQQIMQCQDIAPTQFGMFCNPRQDHGPADWHRDIRPPVHGNVESHFTDFLANPPHYTQWNIALYDDDVLWVIPSSHRRFNTEAENKQLAHSEHEPVDGGIPIDLKAGDGVVYLTPILHWGSNYSTRHRRTMQFAYRGFNNGSLTHAYHLHWMPDIIDRLPEHLSARFRRFLELKENEYDLMERTFRSMIAKDQATFLERLVALHSDTVGRMSCVLHLCKIAQGQIRQTRGPLGCRFTQEQAELLWQRFVIFDRLLQVDEPYLIPGFQTKEPSTYNFNEMPAMNVEQFIASW
jgi:ectoine hydroxylase-related dioxygenase (phytanoyl-CoA dioxygenase family)